MQRQKVGSPVLSTWKNIWEGTRGLWKDFLGGGRKGFEEERETEAARRRERGRCRCQKAHHRIKQELRCQVKDSRETGTLRVWPRVSGGVCMKTPSGIFRNISTWHSRNRTKPCEPNSEALVLFTNWQALEKCCSNRFHCESWANLEGKRHSSQLYPLLADHSSFTERAPLLSGRKTSWAATL